MTPQFEKVFHLRIARALEREINETAQRMHTLPAEVARIALARGLRGLSEPQEVAGKEATDGDVGK